MGASKACPCCGAEGGDLELLVDGYLSCPKDECPVGTFKAVGGTHASLDFEINSAGVPTDD